MVAADEMVSMVRNFVAEVAYVDRNLAYVALAVVAKKFVALELVVVLAAARAVSETLDYVRSCWECKLKLYRPFLIATLSLTSLVPH